MRPSNLSLEPSLSEGLKGAPTFFCFVDSCLCPLSGTHLPERVTLSPDALPHGLDIEPAQLGSVQLELAR
jgi:hypothetical protein